MSIQNGSHGTLMAKLMLLELFSALCSVLVSSGIQKMGIKRSQKDLAEETIVVSTLTPTLSAWTRYSKRLKNHFLGNHIRRSVVASILILIFFNPNFF